MFHVPYKLLSYHTQYMREPIENSKTLIWPFKIIKGHEVNWKAIYYFIYVFQINFGHKMHRLWDGDSWKLCDLEFTFKGHPLKSKIMRSTERSYMISYISFIEILILRCTVYDMQPLENSVTLISPIRVIQGHEVSWKILYDCFI